LESGQESLAFEAVLDFLVEQGWVPRRSRQRLDSPHVWGLLRVMSRLERARETLRLWLEDLEAHDLLPVPSRPIAPSPPGPLPRDCDCREDGRRCRKKRGKKRGQSPFSSGYAWTPFYRKLQVFLGPADGECTNRHSGPRIEKLLEEWAPRLEGKDRRISPRLHRQLIEEGYSIIERTVREYLAVQRRQSAEVSFRWSTGRARKRVDFFDGLATRGQRRSPALHI